MGYNPSYKWTNPTYPIYNQGYNPLTKWDEPPSTCGFFQTMIYIPVAPGTSGRTPVETQREQLLRSTGGLRHRGGGARCFLVGGIYKDDFDSPGKTGHTLSGWWFGTFVIFPYIGNNHPN